MKVPPSWNISTNIDQSILVVPSWSLLNLVNLGRSHSWSWSILVDMFYGGTLWITFSSLILYITACWWMLGNRVVNSYKVNILAISPNPPKCFENPGINNPFSYQNCHIRLFFWQFHKALAILGRKKHFFLLSYSFCRQNPGR